MAVMILLDSFPIYELHVYAVVSLRYDSSKNPMGLRNLQ